MDHVESDAASKPLLVLVEPWDVKSTQPHAESLIAGNDKVTFVPVSVGYRNPSAKSTWYRTAASKITADTMYTDGDGQER